MLAARSIRVHGVVQGVGFRPFVYRLAQAHHLAGWVLNEENGVEIHLEGAEPALAAFLRGLEAQPPPAARITGIDVCACEPAGMDAFTIRHSTRSARPSVRVSPDLPVCDECVRELFDPRDPRYLYPYINCTNCGPRYSVIERLPYDRPNTTMRQWPLDELCAAQYDDPTDRRFHAQPVACAACGPHYELRSRVGVTRGDRESIAEAARLLAGGEIIAVKGIGGYHLACDARNGDAVRALRERKYRKEKPFALMTRNAAIAHELAHFSEDAVALLESPARPIVLAPAKQHLEEVSPDNDDLGIMLPYAPLHHLLFAAGAPDVLVMTSANRSSEPIAYQDQDACERLTGIAHAFLIGERPIARRVDDSIARAGAFGPVIVRRSRGYAPGAVATLPVTRPILSTGADLKNTVTLVIDGQAFVSQHIGDLSDYQALESFRQTIDDLTSMYDVDRNEVMVAHDVHPQYFSTAHALELPASRHIAVQHHRAHIASVMAEGEFWDQRVIGVSFDGTGYGDDGTIWGGEFFAGSVASGFERILHVRTALLPGGDAAARSPVQCAAGFLNCDRDLTAAPFHFPARYTRAMQLIQNNVRVFRTSSVGRLFDAAAALLGFVRDVSFEGQAAMWLEHLARRAPTCEPYPFPVADDELDYRPLLAAIIDDRVRARDPREIARAFQRGIAAGLCDALRQLCEAHGTNTVALSGGVFQNELLLEDVKELLAGVRIEVLTNHAVPPNDGGISLGQAALAAFAP